MIYYDLIEGDAYAKSIHYRPKTCFVMTQLGDPVPRSIINIRRALKRNIDPRGIKLIDAGHDVTGKDFLNKIWDIILSVPLGIAVITSDMSTKAVSNVFYELGLMQALGKETLVIKTKDVEVPSDFVRTEYIEYPSMFKSKIDKYLDKVFAQAEHCSIMASELEQNPELAIDYLIRAYLIDPKPEYKIQILDLIINSSFLNKQSAEVVRNFLRSALRIS